MKTKKLYIIIETPCYNALISGVEPLIETYTFDLDEALKYINNNDMEGRKYTVHAPVILVDDGD